MELSLLEENPMNMDQDDNWNALIYSIQETGVWKENPIIVEKREDGITKFQNMIRKNMKDFGSIDNTEIQNSV